MADREIETRIDAAIARLCDNLDAIYTNFFEPHTPQYLFTRAVGGRRVFPTGTYACGLWETGEDIHLICVSRNTAETFWNYLKENLHLDEDAKLPKRHDDATIELSAPKYSKMVDRSLCCLPEFVELSRKDKAGCKFFFHYAEAPSSCNIDHIKHAPIPYHPSLPGEDVPAQRNIYKISDLQDLAFMLEKQSERERQEFFKVVRTVRSWAGNHGLTGSKFGFFDSNSFMCLVEGASEKGWWWKVDDVQEKGLEIRLKQVFKQLTPHLDCRRTRDTETGLRLYAGNEFRISERLTWEAKEAIYAAMRYAESILLDDAMWPEPQGRGFQDFLKDHEHFFKVECECWASTLEARTEFQEVVVPRNLNKVVESFRNSSIGAGISNTRLRIWPIPVIDSVDRKEEVYVIGIRQYQGALYDPEELNPNDVVEEVLDYDPRVGLISFTIATRDDFEDKSPKDDSVQSSITPNTTLPPPAVSPRTSTSDKFRTARAALSRLRHDPKHVDVIYEVGYEDRFVEGLMWMPLEMWGGKAVEEEDFIPEHRIRQFRRLEDQVVVWDRAERVDLT